MKDDLTRRLAAAAGRETADLVIKNGKIVNVFTGGIIEADIAISSGHIVGIGQYQGKEVLDAAGKYISPGLIDGHVHLESSMLTPMEFAKVLLLHGVTTAVIDPHEIANVAGTKGIEYILDGIKDLPVNLMVMLPSCVPATEFEIAGAKLDAKDLFPYYNHPQVIGLAEVMDFPALKAGNEDLLAKLADAHLLEKKIDGHAAGIGPSGLNVFMAGGIRTDHESTTAEEAKERIEKGMYVIMREGTAAKNLKQLIPAVNAQNSRRFLFGTDDKHLDDLLEDGSIDYHVRASIKEGIAPVTAIQMATLNAAECFGLDKRGAVAPGYTADLVIVDSLEKMKVHTVLKDGRIMVREGQLQLPSNPPATVPQTLTKTVSLQPLSSADLDIPLTGQSANIIEMIPNSLITRHVIENVTTSNGLFQPNMNHGLLKLALAERHHRSGQVAAAIVKGLGLMTGAIASTVTHDSHQMIICGANDDDMLLAASELNRRQGGLIAVQNGKVLACLDLPVAGLISPQPYEEVFAQLKQLDKALGILGCSQEFNPFLAMSFLALPVIPDLKLTLQGLFDVKAQRHLPVDAAIQHDAEIRYSV